MSKVARDLVRYRGRQLRFIIFELGVRPVSFFLFSSSSPFLLLEIKMREPTFRFLSL